MMGRSVNFVGNQNMLLEKDDEAVEWLVFANKFFYYQKYWEFLDTFIFLIRNSYRQVNTNTLHTTLHTTPVTPSREHCTPCARPRPSPTARRSPARRCQLARVGLLLAKRPADHQPPPNTVV